MIQKSFFDSKSESSKSRIAYGGKTRGRRKVFRPMDRKRPLHITLKSSHAKGRMSFLSHKIQVAKIIESRAAKDQIKIHRFVNMGNHIHILASFKRREFMQRFLRVTTGLIARLVTNAKKGHAFGKRFWDHLAHSRIVTSRMDFGRILHYFDKNSVERDNGPALRRGMELYDEISKEALKRNVPRDVIRRERLKKAAGLETDCDVFTLDGSD